jgi:dTDP-4-amino-4,6-dideoxygalactose transaminase
VIPFNKPYIVGTEAKNIAEVLASNFLSGDGIFTKKCSNWLENHNACSKALLTHSCTAALEMAALLLDIKMGDEVIMPSYTFVSTANAFVLRGARPVFVDIRDDTKNINEELIEAAITDSTKAIVCVHYAGVSCEMNKINDIAEKYNLFVVEDAAQGICSKYYGNALGSLSDLGTFSFHETKNINSGEGGALLVNNPNFVERAEIIREKGTNRSKFYRGEIDKYTWVDLGSSYLPSEIMAAFLFSQMQEANAITEKRLDIWNRYHNELKILEEKSFIERPFVPSHCNHNAHMYYIILNSEDIRKKFISYMKDNSIHCTFHYQPLHDSPIYRKKFPDYDKIKSNLSITNKVSKTLVRIPIWIGIDSFQDFIIEKLIKFFE